MDEFISVDRARSVILEAVNLQPQTTIGFEEALGYTLAEKIVSKDQIPPFSNSAMDGYAVCTADFDALPASLQVIGQIPAGEFPSEMVRAGTCMKIMTGAPFPEGADAIVPIEWVVREEDETVVFDRAPKLRQHVRPAGQDVGLGEKVMDAGEVITPPIVGMLATLGFDKASVYVPPTCAVIATGDELVEPGEPLGPGLIRNSSGGALRAQVLRAGGKTMQPLVARDNLDSIASVIEASLAADMLIFAGGVSVGDYDLIKQVLDDFGMEMSFWKVKQRPGKPLAFGMLKGKPVFGLPGNPVSSAMCFEQYVRPAIAKMLGRKNIRPAMFEATLTRETKKVKGLHFFARGIAEQDEQGHLVVKDTGSQASNLYSSVVKANCIFHLPEQLEAAPAGTKVLIEWLNW